MFYCYMCLDFVVCITLYSAHCERFPFDWVLIHWILRIQQALYYYQTGAGDD